MNSNLICYFISFFLSGKALWLLTEDMFKKRVPNSGDILYKALQNLIPKTSNHIEGIYSLCSLETFSFLVCVALQ